MNQTPLHRPFEYVPPPGDWLTEAYKRERRRIELSEQNFRSHERIFRCQYCGDWAHLAFITCKTCGREL